MPPRPQPYRLEWPLNAHQMEAIDEMFQILFEDLGNNTIFPTTTEGDTMYQNDENRVIRLGIGGANTFLRTNGVVPEWGKVNLSPGTDTIGTLSVTSGGTGSTAFTAGSVIFVGPGGTTLTQDNPNFFWDDSANHLRLGNAVRLEWKDSTGTPRFQIYLHSDDHAYFDNAGLSKDFIFRIDNLNEVLRLDFSQNVRIGGALGPTSVNASGTLVFPDLTAPTTMAANTAGVYANDVTGTVELFGINEAGVATQLTGVVAPVLASGTYTPTLTNVANLDASTAYEAQYLRVGNTVTVSGRVDIDPTLAATSTQLGISLPVASNIGALEDVAGVAFASGIGGQGAAILGDATNNRAQLQYIAGDISNQAMYMTFSYQII